MSDTVIRIENVSKLYRLGQVGTGTISHDLNRWWHRVRGKEDPYLKIGQINNRAVKGDSDYAWALKDISFEVKRGDVVGIIGRNGAGKSTLLKILSRVTTPTSGEIKIKGRVASLLEVGTGFNPELTGRENIYLNGAIMGMRKREIDVKFDEIVAFAAVERYIDTPVKRYSSGMYVRLAFAVAAHLEPEILIVDEVLAVGDAEFQKKCMGKMQDVAGHGRTILFVSHNMAAINSLCTKGVAMQAGAILSIGSVASCIEAYLNGLKAIGSTWERPAKSHTSQPVVFSRISVNLTGEQPELVLEITFEIEPHSKYRPAFMAVDILNDVGVAIMQAIPTLDYFIKDDSSCRSFRVDIQLPPMVPGHYSVTLWMGPHNTETYDIVTSVVSFDIKDTPTKGRRFPHTRDHGFIVPHSSFYELPAL
jgi:lipopolysaccharide transport system ATP-binding protein